MAREVLAMAKRHGRLVRREKKLLLEIQPHDIQVGA